jgi:monoamine oxidase
MNMTNVYDACFVGSGIASLYAAYKYKLANPGSHFVILEKGSQIGGRMLTREFIKGFRVPMGAGVGRLEKDTRLKRLLTHLGISYKNMVFPKKINYSMQQSPNLKPQLAALHRNIANAHDKSFKIYAQETLGSKEYAQFIQSIGYTDFEDADAQHTLKHYGFDDAIEDGQHFFRVDWHLVTNKLLDFIGIDNVITKSTVESIVYDDQKKVASIHVSSKTSAIHAKQVFIGTALDGLLKLFPTIKEQIGSNTFIRIYAQLDRPLHIEYTTISPFANQKIIPMDIQRNIYMIAYSDNESAEVIHRLAKSKDVQALQAMLPIRDAKIIKMTSKYWKHGTHFFKPGFNKVSQRPHGNTVPIYIIGECVSKHHQGWVEGALESVDDVMPAKLYTYKSRTRQ